MMKTNLTDCTIVPILLFYDCKATCKRTQNYWPTTLNIVVCCMLHVVGCCCVLLR